MTQQWYIILGLAKKLSKNQVTELFQGDNICCMKKLDEGDGINIDNPHEFLLNQFLDM